jgi:hypothetical protein
MLAEVLQSEGSHDGVYQIVGLTLYRSANWKCTTCGKIALFFFLVLCFFSLVLQFNAFCFLIPTFEVKSQ